MTRSRSTRCPRTISPTAGSWPTRARTGQAEDRPPARRPAGALGVRADVRARRRLPGAAGPGSVGRVLAGRRASSGSIATAGRQRVWRRRQCGGAKTITIAGPGALELVRARSGRAGGGRSRARARPRRAAAGVAVPGQRAALGWRPVGAAVAVPGVAGGRASGGRAGVRAARDRFDRARARGRSRRAGGARDALPRHASSWRSGTASASRRRSHRAGRIAGCGCRRRRCRRRRCRAPTPRAPRTSPTSAIREPFTAALAGARHEDAQRGRRRATAGAALAARGRVRGMDRRAGAPDRRSGGAARAATRRRRASTSRRRAIDARRGSGPGSRASPIPMSPRRSGSPTTRCGSSGSTRSPARPAAATTR